MDFWSKSEGKKPYEVLGTDGRVVLKWILKKYGGRMWSGFI
jgi:hypothetical protein